MARKEVDLGGYTSVSCIEGSGCSAVGIPRERRMRCWIQISLGGIRRRSTNSGLDFPEDDEIEPVATEGVCCGQRMKDKGTVSMAS